MLKSVKTKREKNKASDTKIIKSTGIAFVIFWEKEYYITRIIWNKKANKEQNYHEPFQN